MTRLPAHSAVAVLLLLASCGKSAEEVRMDKFRASCLALTGQTLDQAIQVFSNPTPPIDCASPQATHLKGSTCDYTQYVCSAFFSSCANDMGLCGAPPLGGCLFFCQVQFPGTQNAGAVDPTSVICGERFVSGQAGYPYCIY